MKHSLPESLFLDFKDALKQKGYFKRSYVYYGSLTGIILTGVSVSLGHVDVTLKTD